MILLRNPGRILHALDWFRGYLLRGEEDQILGVDDAYPGHTVRHLVQPVNWKESRNANNTPNPENGGRR